MSTSLVREGPWSQPCPPLPSRTRSAGDGEAGAAEHPRLPLEPSQTDRVLLHDSLSFSEATESTVTDADSKGARRLAHEELSTAPSSLQFAHESDTEAEPQEDDQRRQQSRLGEEVTSPLVYAPMADASSLETSPRLCTGAVAGRTVTPSDSERESPLFYPEAGAHHTSSSISAYGAPQHGTGAHGQGEEEGDGGNNDGGAGGAHSDTEGAGDGGPQPRTSRKLVYSASGTAMSPRGFADAVEAHTAAAARGIAERPRRALPPPPPPPPPVAAPRHPPPPPHRAAASDADVESAMLAMEGRLKRPHGGSGGGAAASDMQSDGVVASRRSSPAPPHSAPVSPLTRDPRGSFADISPTATDAGLVRSAREDSYLAQQQWPRQRGSGDSASTEGRRSGCSPATEVLAAAAAASAEATTSPSSGYTFFSTQLPLPEDRRAHIYELAKALRVERARSASATTPVLGERLLASLPAERGIDALMSPVQPPVTLRADDDNRDGEGWMEANMEEHGDESGAVHASHPAPADTSLSIEDTTAACGDMAVFLSNNTPLLPPMPTAATRPLGEGQADARDSSEAAGPLQVEPRSSSDRGVSSKTTTEGIAFTVAAPVSLTLHSSASLSGTPSTAQRPRPPPRILCPPTPSPSRSRSTGGALDLLLGDTAAAEPDATDFERAAAEQSLFSGPSLLTAAAPLPSVSRVATSAEGGSTVSTTLEEVVAGSRDLVTVSTATAGGAASALSAAVVADSALTTSCGSPGWSLSASVAPPAVAEDAGDAGAAGARGDSGAASLSVPAAVVRADADATLSNVGASSPASSCAEDEGADQEVEEQQQHQQQQELEREEDPLAAPEMSVCVGEVGAPPPPSPSPPTHGGSRRPSSESVYRVDGYAQRQPRQRGSERGASPPGETRAASTDAVACCPSAAYPAISTRVRRSLVRLDGSGGVSPALPVSASPPPALHQERQSGAAPANVQRTELRCDSTASGSDGFIAAWSLGGDGEAAAAVRSLEEHEEEEQEAVDESEESPDVMDDATECGALSSRSNLATADAAAGAPSRSAASAAAQHPQRGTPDSAAITTASPSAASPSPIRPPSTEGSADDEAHLMLHCHAPAHYPHSGKNEPSQTATTSSVDAGAEGGDEEEAHLFYTGDSASAPRPAHGGGVRDGGRTWHSEMMAGMYDDDNQANHNDDEESAAAQTPVEVALCRVGAKNAVLRLELAAARERTEAAEASCRAREVECAELHALADRLHAELAAAQAAARVAVMVPQRVEAPAPPVAAAPLENALMWQQRHYALTLELAAMKGAVAEQLAVLDRLGLQPPFTEEAVCAAERRVRRVRVANAAGTATKPGRPDPALHDTPCTPIRPLCVNESPRGATAKPKSTTASDGNATIAALLDQRRQRQLQPSAATASLTAALSSPVPRDQPTGRDAASADKENTSRVRV